MAHSKKRFATLNRFLGEARKMFPNTSWSVYQAGDEINDVYGPGFILVGKRGIYEKEFFILFEDQRRIEWAAMINGELEDLVENGTR